MAECSEIEAGGEVRTIKDATARNGVATNAAAIAEIEKVIPSTASASNLLITQNEVKTSQRVLLTTKTIPGLTIAWSPNLEKAHAAWRVVNLAILNIDLTVSGTYTGQTQTIEMFNMPNTLLKQGEYFETPYSQYFGWDNLAKMPCGLWQANSGLFLTNQEIFREYHGQIILPIAKN